MADTVKTMVEGVMENQTKACNSIADILSSVGGELGSQDLEAIAQSVAMMAAARRQLEAMAAAVAQAQAKKAETSAEE